MPCTSTTRCSGRGEGWGSGGPGLGQADNDAGAGGWSGDRSAGVAVASGAARPPSPLLPKFSKPPAGVVRAMADGKDVATPPATPGPTLSGRLGLVGRLGEGSTAPARIRAEPDGAQR